jgi:predicted amidohydrolase
MTRVRLTLASDLASVSTLRDPGDIILFPELVDGGYAALRKGNGVHTPGDATLRHFRSLSLLPHTSCVAGSFALRRPRGDTTNSVLVFQRGRCIHRYDKIHLFRPAEEPRYFTSGRHIHAFTISVGRTRLRAGVILCYDLRFPELTRFLAREGIELLLVPARWPSVRDEAWRSLLKARAIENQMFVAGCNARGEEGGQSYVFDPMGTLLAKTGTVADQAGCTVELDCAMVRSVRKRMHYLDDAVLLKRLALPRGFTQRPPSRG